MDCSEAREAISASIDGEDLGLPREAVDAHLAGCADCRSWRQRAHALTRRARLGSVFLDHDLLPVVLATSPRVPASRGNRVQRVGLLVTALAQMAITVPLLILGHDHGAGTHAAHELGSFDLALAIAFTVGAIRPTLSAGLAWPCGVAAAGLAGTAIVDMIAGQTFGADEAQHLIAVAGALLLFWQVRTTGRDSGLAAAGLVPVPPSRYGGETASGSKRDTHASRAPRVDGQETVA